MSVFLRRSLFFAAFLVTTITFGQVYMPPPLARFNVKHISDENGLPQNSVKSIVQDNRGNIWLATERGIVRFDGINYKVFDEFGSSNRYQSIGAFHISPEDDRRTEFFAVNNEHTYIRIFEGKAEIDPKTYINFIKGQPFQTPEKEDLFLTNGVPNVNDGHIKASKLAIALGQDRFYVYDKSNIYYYDHKKLRNSFELLNRPFGELFRIGNRLYHFQGKKLTCFDGTKSRSAPKEVLISGDIHQNPLFSKLAGLYVYWTNCNDQAFIMLDKSLYQLSTVSDTEVKTTLICEGFDFDKGIISNVYYDPTTGRLFLGSHFFGLYVLEPKPFQTLTATFDKTDNVYYGQAPFGKSQILSNQGHLFTLDNEQQIGPARHLKTISDIVGWDKIGILIDSNKRIWCKKSHALFMLAPGAQRVLSKWDLPFEITQLYQDKDGMIWIGTKQKGLYRIDPQSADPQVESILQTSISNISWIERQPGNILWVGTGDGLRKIDLNTKRVTSVAELKGLYVRSLHFSNEGNQFWITTYNDGFFLLQSGKLTRFPIDQNRYLASAHCIFEDEQGYFWITTNKGLFQVKRTDLLAYAQKPFDIYYYYYDKQAGFNTNEFNGGCQPCAIRTGNGLVSLPSINGLVFFRPEVTRPELPTGDIHIESVIINENLYAFHEKPISLSPQTREAAIKLNIPYLGNQSNLKITYRLYEGNDPVTDWKSVDPANQLIMLPHLQSGNYHLSIRKLNGFGIQNFVHRKVEILVLKDWYETWWFTLTILLGAGVLFIFALRWRTRRIEQQKLVLETSVRERTRDLETVLKALGNSEKQLEQQLRLHIHMIASVSHDIRTPIKYVGTALRYLQSPIKNNQPEVALGAIGTVLQTLAQLEHMIDNIVSFIKPGMYRSLVGVQEVNLNQIVSERCAIFADVMQLNGSAVSIAVDPQISVQTNPDMLGIIVHNLVDNAIKAQKGNSVSISSDLTKIGNVSLNFSDRGPGLPAHVIIWLNADDTEGSGLPDNFNGLGVPMIKEIAKLLGIRIYASNNNGGNIRLTFQNV